MSALVPLHFENDDVRMVMRDGEPWWVLNDVCAILEIASPRNAATRLYDWQKDYVQISDAIGRSRRTIVVNEPGIYSLVLGSNKSEAERFAHWLFAEVLPSIRQHGCYPPPIEVEGACNAGTSSEIPATQAGRFLEEIARWEQRTGYEFASIFRWNKQKMYALTHVVRDDVGPMLERGRLWRKLLNHGFDLFYILNGNRLNENEIFAMTRPSLPQPSRHQMLDHRV